MTTIYNYTNSADFTSTTDILISDLVVQINDDAGIGLNPTDANLVDNELFDITFASALSGAQKTALDVLIANYVYSVPAASKIDATTIADGTVTDTEFQYINSLTSNVQTQLNAKSASSHVHTTADIVSGTFTDARIASSNVTQHEGAITIGNLINAPTGAVIGTTDTQALTNKTIDAGLNTITGLASTDVGLGNVENLKVNLAATTAPSSATDDVTLGYSVGSRWFDTTADKEYVCMDATDGAAVWVETTVSADGGEVNTASSAGGTSLVKTKVGDDLPFKGLTATSTKVSLAANANDIGLDVVEANIVIGNLSGAPVGAVIGTTDAQTLTNKTIDTASNTITVTAGDVSSGTFTDARIASSNVTQHEGAITIGNLINAPTGAVIGTTDTQALTNKTIDAGLNTITGLASTDVGLGNVENLKVNLAATTAPSSATDDVTLGYSVGSRWFDTTADKEYVCMDATDGAAVWVETTVSADGGEVNTASSAGGTSLVKTKVGDDLPFKGLTATSTKVSLAANANDIGLDVVEANIVIGNLSGAPVGAVIGTTDAQTLTNKTIDTASNTITVAAGDVSSGTFTDARIASSNVTQHEGAVTIGNLINAPTGAVIGTTDTQTLTNKTIDAGLNTITGLASMDVGLGNVENLKVNLAATTAPVAATDDVTLGYSVGSRWFDTTADKEYVCMDATDGAAVWVETTVGADGGEVNTASSAGGTSLVKTKVGDDLPFKGLTATSTKISLAANANDIGIDVTEANIVIGNLSGAPTGAVVGISDAQTLTNKTIDAGNNTITGLAKTDVGLTNVENLKVNLSATAAPSSATDDVTLGYSVGSRWFDVTADKEYVCLDATDAAAVWVETTRTGEVNTASSAGGTSLVKTKVGDDLPFKGLTATSTKVSLASNANDIGIDVTEANIVIGNLSGAPTGAVVGISHTQTLTNKTLTSSTNNVISNGLHSATTTVAVSAATAPTSGQVLTATSGTVANWQTPSGGVFGTEFEYFESLSILATTATTYVQKARFTTSSIPAGDYLIHIFLQQTTDAKSLKVGSRAQIDDTTTLFETLYQMTVDSVYYNISAIKKVTLSSGTHNIDIDHLTETGAGAGSRVKDIVCYIYRTS